MKAESSIERSVESVNDIPLTPLIKTDRNSQRAAELEAKHAREIEVARAFKCKPAPC